MSGDESQATTTTKVATAAGGPDEGWPAGFWQTEIKVVVSAAVVAVLVNRCERLAEPKGQAPAGSAAADGAVPLVEAVSSYDAQVAASPRDPGWLTMRATIRLTLGQVDAAIQDLDKALALDPRRSFALDEYERAMARATGSKPDPEEPHFHLDRARPLMTRGDSNPATRDLGILLGKQVRRAVRDRAAIAGSNPVLDWSCAVASESEPPPW